MSNELIDSLTALLIIAFVFGRGIVLLKDWLCLNPNAEIEEEKAPVLQAKPQQVLQSERHCAVYAVMPKNPIGAANEDYNKETIKRAV
jgi:hypothetical protein